MRKNKIKECLDVLGSLNGNKQEWQHNCLLRLYEWVKVGAITNKEFAHIVKEIFSKDDQNA